MHTFAKPSKVLSFAISFVSIFSSCKTTYRSPIEHSAVLEADSVGGFDVNDVSIMFERTGDGAFYPAIDVGRVWPKQAFDDLITFSRDGSLNGIAFGQFILPPDYAELVAEYSQNPQNFAPVGDQKRKAAKDIAVEIARNNTKCTPKPDRSLLCIDASAQVSYSNHRDAIADQRSWRIVSMRMDLCASAHNGEGEQCEVEFRLIAQPFGDFAPVPPPPPINGVRQPAPPLTTSPGQRGSFMFDVSAHLLYKIGKLNLETGNITDNSGRIVNTASEIINDLKKIKEASPVTTNGRPLGVHPGLRAEAKSNGVYLKDAILKFVGKYTSGGKGLTNVTSMHLAGPTTFDASVWVFFQGVIEGHHWTPTPITGSNTVWSIRTASVQGAGGKMFPPPQLQNKRASIDPIFEFGPGAVPPQDKATVLPQDIADLPSFFDNPGRFGDPALGVNGKVASSVRNSDCVSCHMTATRSFEWGVHSIDAATGKLLPSMYIPPVGVTAYLDPEVIPRIDYNLRNFGYFLPPPIENPQAAGLGIFNFVGKRVEKPAIMTRVVYESAELVNLINTRFLNAENPGLRCQGEDPREALLKSLDDKVFTKESQNTIRRDAATHAAVSDCLLFESYKPGMSFETCTRLCTSSVNKQAANDKCNIGERLVCDGTQGCGWSVSQSLCIDITKSECSYYKDRSWCSVTTNCKWESGACVSN